MTEQAMVVRESTGEVLDIGIHAVVGVEEAVRRVEELQRFVGAVMVKDQDYGVIPGTKKPSLLKSGAEKLCELYGLSITIPEERIRRMEDWDRGVFAYEVVCTLVSRRDGHIVAEGIGACNTREPRYANQSPFTLVNTVLKMAKKRAVIDAALSATRSSGIFTQDVEDIAENQRAESKRQSRPANAPGERRGPPSRAALEARYDDRADVADSLMVAYEKRDPNWTDAQLIDKGKELHAKIQEAESKIPTT